MKQGIRMKLMCILMAMAVVIAYMPLSAHAELSGEQKEAAGAPSDEVSLEDTLQLEEVSRDNALLKESDEAVTVFRRDDGKKTAVFHGRDVRFRDESGKLRDYDPSLRKIESEKTENGKSLRGYAYVNSEGDSLQYFPERLSEETPVLMEKESFSIAMHPSDVTLGKAETEKGEILTPYEEVKSIRNTVSYETEDGNITYEYISLDSGVKESIILNEKPES